MAFDDIEQSEDDGDLIELYTWTGQDLSLLETTDRFDVDLGGGLVYAPAAIVRREVEMDSDHVNQMGLEIEVPLDHPAVLRHRVLVPSERMTLRIQQKHRSLADVEGAWLGFVRNVTIENGRPVVRCEAIPGSYKREGLRPVYDRKCTHHLYDPHTCRAVAASFLTTGTITAISGGEITATEFGALAAGYLALGKAVVGSELRLITNHVGSVITVNQVFAGAAVGDTIQAYAGCDRLKATCIAKFNNLANHGGCAWLPTKDPYAGGIDV